jgi:mannosyltransferase OCH1-like enzyme
VRIPKIIHQIWLGGPVPEEFESLMASWKVMHPDWIYLLWTDENVDVLTLKNDSLFQAARNYGQKADIVRYELLNQFGGLYVDVDFRCLKRFDIFHQCYDFYIGIANTGTADLGIGLIGSIPGHPILNEVIGSMKESIPLRSPDDVLLTTGNVHFMQAFMKVAPDCPGRIITLPCSYFYPLPNKKRFLPRWQQDAYIKPESHAIHYWACSWQRDKAFL